MVEICGVCDKQDSKYKCPVCELRYCSIACYKPHKASHESETATVDSKPKQPTKDRPGTTQRVPKVDFTGFEDDKDFQRLLTRYPALRVQLQTIYALTLEPAPEDARSWNRTPLPGFDPPAHASRGRGRGRGFRGGRGGFGRGGKDVSIPQGRQHGRWTQAKGDQEALDVIKRLRRAEDESEEAEGLREFVALCQIKFGETTGTQ